MSLLLLVLLVLVAVDSIGYADPYVHTLAGSGQVGSADGIGALASFDTPFGVAVDWATNNVIVADCDNNAIRRVTQSGVVSTLNLTSTLTLDGPTDLVFDSHGNLFVSLIRRHIIVKIASNLAVTAWAGNGTSGTMNGDGTSAMFRNPAGLAIDAHDNLYVADSGNNLVRKVTPTGTVSTVAGGFSRPWGVAIAPSGTIYVSDTSNFQIKQVDTAGKVSVLAGSGTVGSREGVGLAATFDYPYGIRLDPNGNLFVAEYGSNRIRKVTTPLGNVTTYAGGIGGYADGPSLTANFQHPAGLAFGPDGTMYVADEVGERIRIITTRPRSTSKATTTGGRTPAPTPAPSTSFVATNGTYYCSQQGATSQNVPIGLGGSVSIASHPTGRFASGLDCTFVITASVGHVVQLVFPYLYLTYGDFLVVYDGNGTSSILEASTSTTAISTGRTMTVVFTSANANFGWTARAYDVPVPTTNTLPTCSGGERPDHQCGPMFGNSGCSPGRCCSTFGWCGAYFQPMYCSTSSFACALPYNDTVRASQAQHPLVSGPTTPPYVYCGLASQATLVAPNDNTWVYSAGMDCAVTITATPGRVVQFTTSEASLYGSDAVTIFDGNTTKSTVIAVLVGNALALSGSITSTGRSMTIAFSIQQASSWWAVSVADVAPVVGLVYCTRASGQILALTTPGQQVTVRATGQNCTMTIATNAGQSVAVTPTTTYYDQRVRLLAYDVGSSAPLSLSWTGRQYVSSGNTLTIAFVAAGPGLYTTGGAVSVSAAVRPTAFCTSGAQELNIAGVGQNVTISSAYVPADCALTVKATAGRAVRVVFSSVGMWLSDTLTVTDGYKTQAGSYTAFTSYGPSVTIASHITGSYSTWQATAFDVPRPPMPTLCTGAMNLAMTAPGQNATIVSTSTPNCTLVVTATPGRALRLLFSSVEVWQSGDYLTVGDGYHTYSAVATYWNYPSFTSYGRSLTISSRTLGSSSSWTVVAFDVPSPPMPTFCTGNQHVAIAGPGQNVTISVAYMATNCSVVVRATPGRSVKLVFASISMYEMGDALNVDDGVRTHNPLQSRDPTFTSYGGSLTISSLVTGSHSSWTIVAIDVPRPTLCTGAMNLNLPCSGPPVPISSFTLTNCTLVITAAPQCIVRMAFQSYSMWGRDSAVAIVGASTYPVWMSDALTGHSVTITSTLQQAGSYWTAVASTAPLPTTVIQTTTSAFCQGPQATAVCPGLGRQLEIWGGNVDCSITVTSSSPGRSVQLTFRTITPSISVYDATTNVEVSVAVGVPIVSTGRSLTIVFANAKPQTSWWLAIATDYQASQTMRLVRRAMATTRPSGGFTRGVVGYVLRVRFAMTLLAFESLDAAKDRFQNGESAALGIGKDRIIIETATVNAPSNTVTLVISFKSSTPADQAAVLATLEDPNNPGVATFDALTVQTMHVCQDGRQVTSSDQCTAAALETVRAAARAMTSPSHSTVAVLLVIILTLQF
ncbi:CUB domain-containing protein [Plasmodiophora brassicae]